MHRSLFSLCVLLVVVQTFLLSAAERIPELRLEDFDALRAAIYPQPGASPWREIPWMTNITEARLRAVAEDKPIVIFTAADGSPLGRT